MTSYDLVDIGPVNGLLSDVTKALLEPMLTCQHDEIQNHTFEIIVAFSRGKCIY